jgi:hypothetical protein
MPFTIFIVIENLAPVVFRGAYNHYWDKPDLTEPIFQLFLDHPSGTYSMPSVHANTGVPLTTLYSWREQVRVHAEWRLHSMVAEGFLDDSALNFKCSNHFLSAFLRRQNLSFRRARSARRPPFDDQECAMFVIQVAKASKEYSESNILNFDESNWRLVMASEQVIGERGAEVVHNYTDGDAKASSSFFASIWADGTKLPLI